MAYREYLPHPALRPFVDRFWTSAPPPGPGAAGPQPILPDGCIDLIVNPALGGRADVVGTMTRALMIAEGASERMLQLLAVRFRPGGAAPFLRTSAHQLTDRRIEVGQIGARSLIPPGLGDATPLQAVALWEQALLRQMPASPFRDLWLDHVLGRLTREMAPSIDAVAREVGCSRQHLGRVFRAQVGLGPKQFARVARLQRTVARLQDAPRASAADVAVSMGYFDQAHMIGEFAALVGMTPLAVRKSPGSIFPIRSLLGGA